MTRTSSGTPFVSQVRVRFADTDAEGVVYYGSYLTYFEVARVELLRSLGFPVAEVKKRGVAFPAVAADCRYHRPGFVDECLDVCLWLDDCRRSSFGFIYEVRRGAEVLASGYTRHACIELQSARAIRRPDWFADLWERAAAEQSGPPPVSAGEGEAPHGEYTVIWRYVVHGQDREEFERAYGPEGGWARFFASGDGYKKTRLLRDETAAGAYVVEDVWESSDHYRRFLESNREEYERRSRDAEGLYATEERLGEFSAPAGAQ
jgi:acyl-CoA thioester hydrolase